jgi:hypothetical protein
VLHSGVIAGDERAPEPRRLPRCPVADSPRRGARSGGRLGTLTDRELVPPRVRRRERPPPTVEAVARLSCALRPVNVPSVGVRSPPSHLEGPMHTRA